MESRLANNFDPDVSVESSLRAHDQAMIELLQEVIYRNEPAAVKSGHESRMFAQTHERSKSVKGQTRQSIPLPQIVLTNLGAIPDIRRWTRNPIRDYGINATNRTPYLDDTQDEIFFLPFPMPLDISYQVDIWSKTMQQMNELRTQILVWWQEHPTEAFIKVELPGYREKIIPLILNRDDDTSDLESEEGERQLRHTISLTLKGWIFKFPFRRVLQDGKVVLEPITTKTIKIANVALVDGDHTDTTFTNWYCDPANHNYGGTDGTQLLSIDESVDYAPPDRVVAIVSFNEGTQL